MIDHSKRITKIALSVCFYIYIHMYIICNIYIFKNNFAVKNQD